MPVWFGDIQQFDELYSVSDLHMGGSGAGAQIFNAGSEFAGFVAELQGRKGRIALVINGDMVDFLAEPEAMAFDPQGVVGKLKRMEDDDAFRPVWKALQDFVAVADHRLIVTLGNHDVELALPWARDYFLNLLAKNDDAARGRIVLAFDGAGFLCRVGNATVLSIHGNEVDDWNVTDHETIRRTARDMQKGRPADPWIPNAGSRLVVEVMNDIKKQYPFVDLLKPEMQAVLPVLAALAPVKAGQFGSAVQVVKRLAWDKFRRITHLLGEEGGIDVALSAVAEQGPLQRPRMNREALLEQAERRLRQNVEPISLVPDEERLQQLGVPEAIARFASGGETREILRAQLAELIADRSFEWSQQDDTFRKFDDKVAPEVDFILTGHTHLERAIPRRRRNGFYFNSGTWVRLIRFQPEVLVDQEAFNKVFGVLSAGTMDALDSSGLVMHLRTVVAIKAGPAGTRGELMRWDTTGARPALKPVHNLAGMTKS